MLLELSGKVDLAVIRQLFMKSISPGGEVLARQPRPHGGLMSWRWPGSAGMRSMRPDLQLDLHSV
jgi:hypothetical protein